MPPVLIKLTATDAMAPTVVRFEENGVVAASTIGMMSAAAGDDLTGSSEIFLFAIASTY
jgi:hypothetical protein